ncbi:hypothetical protein MNBD_CHLOROFLEXI01-5189, partial [hydrothermal vent metagenome]
NLTATAPNIKNRLPLEKETEMENSLIGRIGDGETNVSFTANGRIILKEGEMVNQKWHDDSTFEADFDFDFSDFGNQISQKLNEQISHMSRKLESTIGPDFAQGLAEKITRKVEQATTRAEKATERTRRRAERQQPWSAKNARPAAQGEPKQKTSSEEHLKILKMVEKGIISPSEAATLLEALEK